MSVNDGLRLTVAWFETAFPAKGCPALGDPEALEWREFCSIFTSWRREGEKDGCNVVPSRLKLEPNGRQVRRKLDRVIARTAVALDVETSKHTGETPPTFADAAERARETEIEALLYTSHSHRRDAPRYRIVLPLKQEISPDLPAVEVAADMLGLGGVLDRSKLNAASLFYLPSSPYGALDQHGAVTVAGAPLGTSFVDTATALQEARQAEADRIATEAHQAAVGRLAARIAAGFDPDDSLIEQLRPRFDLADVLRTHGYDQSGQNFRHPASQSGQFGANVKTLGGIDRVFSHNAGDPLHASNLPSWCSVTAIDAFDAVVILDFAGDRTRAMRELAERFNISKVAARKAVAAAIHRAIRRDATQAEIEAEAYAVGHDNNLTRKEVCDIAAWVNDQIISGKAA